MSHRRKIIQRISLLLICFIASLSSISQTIVVIDSPIVAGTTVAIAGNHFDKSGFHNLFMGRHYRKEWTTPVRVKNFYLDTAAGGLVPTQESGSRQSMGLRLKNNKGKEYVLRSIDKDFGNGLGEIYKGTFIARIAKDQASFGYPYAATTIAPMIAVTGIYHTNPQIIFVPEQPGLGEYNKKYGNQLYLFEERPDENQEDAPYFGNSKNVISTEKLYEHIYGDNDNHVDQKAFAKARLFDMFIGDWGRHADQWRWAEFENDKGTIYKPIPRDRDQAYTIFDGVLPWVATNLVGALFLEKFDHHLNNVERFNRPGRPLDMHFLNELTEQQWIDIAKELQDALTDPVIENAVHQMPPEIFAISGEKIISKLKSRRDDLQKNAKAHYKELSRYVALVGSQKRELFEINRMNSKETQINIYKITKDNEVKDKPYYSRKFKKKETNEIRLYGLEGVDIFKVTGNSKQGVKLRIVDPEKTDSLYLKKNHYNEVSSGPNVEFDTLHKKKFDFSILPLLSPSPYQVFDNDPLELFTRTGVRVSVNFDYISHPWRKAEYENEQLISANFGFLRKATNIGYVGSFNRLIGEWDFLVKARVDVPAVENFYGIGNESPNGKGTATYYSTFSNRLYGGVGVSRDIGNMHHIELGIFYQQIKVDRDGNHFLTTFPSDPSVFSSKQFAGVAAGYNLINTNSHIYPTKGIHFRVGGGYMQNLKDNSRSFFKGSSSFAFYLPLGRSFSLAVRAGGATLSGDADYYHLNTLGGTENLRGYPRERFFGKNTFYNNNELRWVTNTKNIFFNGKIGLLAFYDDGRVWQPGENSKSWHSGYGGGVILIPFNKIALVGTYGISKETTQMLLRAEVFF